jgi:hypothetical protein
MLEILIRENTTHGTRISVLGKGDARAGMPAGNRYFVVHVEAEVTGGDRHPYRAAATARRGATIPAPRKGPTSSVPLVFAAMVLIAGGILAGLFALGH